MLLEMSFYEEAIFCKEQQESREMIDKKQDMFNGCQKVLQPGFMFAF